MYNRSPANLFSPSTLVDLLRWRTAHQPDRRAYTFLVNGETDEISLTYEQLDQRARGIAALLISLEASREPVLLLYSPGLEYIAAFFGCLYAGAIAVPSYLPRANQTLTRLQAVVADSRAKIVLTTASILSKLELKLPHTPGLEKLRWLTTDNVDADWPGRWSAPALASNSIAFLQYTSGSTNTPRGVVLTHGNLLDNLDHIHRQFENTAESLGVIWLPPYHDMGLIGGVLEPLYIGHPVILMSPIAFLQRPLRWLQTIARFRATHSGGPNSAYDLCVRKTTAEQRAELDLSSWQIAFNGAEPIYAETLERFTQAFGPCGFRAESFYLCYGLAEATLLTSGKRRSKDLADLMIDGLSLGQNQVRTVDAESPEARRLVDCGEAVPGHEVAIIDPQTFIRCLPDQVGEIWISGPSVTAGYWYQPEQTEQTFHAYVARTGEGPFLRTGDLGFLRNGKLFVIGRIKDVIIIYGHNHYPQDIEGSVQQSHPILKPGCGAAFAVQVDGEPQLVIVQEVAHLVKSMDVDEIVRAINRAVAENHAVQVHKVVLVKPGSVPRTSSGKIQRYLCRERFLSGDLQVFGT
jgi:acyl-CoA synthetase (AMP-forming)/AMP-acid ligase II